MSFRLISFKLIQALWADVPSASLHQCASLNHAQPQELLRKHTEVQTMGLNKARDIGLVVKG